MAKRKRALGTGGDVAEIWPDGDEIETASEAPKRYRVLRGLTLDGPVYGEKRWRFEAGDEAELEMIAPAMIAHLLRKGVIAEVENG
jgi:hypothetical protein